jgi:hypothetical protein
MRPWSRTASCWRCSCAAQMRASLEDSVRLFAQPKSVQEIASVGPIKRKLIKEHRAPGSRQKLKTRRHWYGGSALIENAVTLLDCRVQSRKGTVISPTARICPRHPAFWLCARRPLQRRDDSANRSPPLHTDRSTLPYFARELLVWPPPLFPTEICLRVPFPTGVKELPVHLNT